MRPARPCTHCGRLIMMDHSLGERNLNGHETACIRKAERKKKRETSRYRRRAEVAAAKARGGIGSTSPPKIGQLGFEFDGVPDEVLS